MAALVKKTVGVHALGDAAQAGASAFWPGEVRGSGGSVGGVCTVRACPETPDRRTRLILEGLPIRADPGRGEGFLATSAPGRGVRGHIVHCAADGP